MFAICFAQFIIFLICYVVFSKKNVFIILGEVKVWSASVAQTCCHNLSWTIEGHEVMPDLGMQENLLMMFQRLQGYQLLALGTAALGPVMELYRKRIYIRRLLPQLNQAVV